MSRTNTELVYQQIKDDLLKAQSLLSENYFDGTLLSTVSAPVRPNKYVAAALLARVYLYLNDWQNAEIQSSAVISNPAYKIESLNDAFLKESKESIWSIQPTGVETEANTGAGKRYVLPATGPSEGYFMFLNNDFVESFELADQRSVTWIKSVNALGIKYSYPYKYKVGEVPSATLEYPIILRLAEQYLIRAEARAQQNKLTGANSAESDINVIRFRAGLGGTAAVSQADLLTAVMTERKHELFAEYGQRWFDLKRTKTIDAVMTPATAKKGGIWKSDAAFYPIPVRELETNSNLVQNKGY